MLLSMTGFGKAVCDLPNKQVTIEIKSLNSKQLDIYARLPNIYKEKELELRNLLSRHLIRGKIEFSITYEITDTSSSTKINLPLVKDYYTQLKELGEELGEQGNESLMQIIMRFPDALTSEKEELGDEEWNMILEKTKSAVQSIQDFRQQEGKALEGDIVERISNILALMKELESYEADRMERVREKLNSGLADIAEQEKLDPNRYEQELIYYLEKMDITEEKVRLANHCKFFGEVIENETSAGKKLGFITQEIGREINTIGSKANHSDIQRIVVQMKDELEKIKEQLMNVL